MPTQSVKTQDSRQPTPGAASKKHINNSTFQSVDVASESIAQRKEQANSTPGEIQLKAIKELADHSPQAMQLKAAKAMMNSSPQAMQLKAFQEIMDNSQRGNPIAQLQGMKENNATQPVQKKENNTGLPDDLKSGMENLSGISLDDVKVHRNSEKPAQLQAHAYAQGTDIHLGPGQEQHLPHEAWHVVQQKQGRVKPTMQMKGKVNVNDDAGLEKEADVMGEKALLSSDGDATDVKFKKSTDHLPPVQKMGTTIIQKKRAREKDDESTDLGPLKQFKKLPIQLHSEIIQLAINAEVPKGTRIMVVNPQAPDTGDVGTVIRPSTVEKECMAVQFDNEPETLYRVFYHEINVISTPDLGALPEETQLLSNMIKNAIANVTEIPDELNKVMSQDKIYNRTPKEQLEKCLEDCGNLSAEKVATYLYTTYFYQPLNRYLRNPNIELNVSIKELIEITHAFITRVFRGTPGEKLTPKFRMELQAEWIGNKGEDDNLSFKGLTSAHPVLDGVNAMWQDIEEGNFGDVTKLALLVFEGHSKLLMPVEKYFPNEVESIFPSGMEVKIHEKYEISWHGWHVSVYHLTVLPESQDIMPDLKLKFDSNGNIVLDGQEGQ